MLTAFAFSTWCDERIWLDVEEAAKVDVKAINRQLVKHRHEIDELRRQLAQVRAGQ